jgi:hypothetical protein
MPQPKAGETAAAESHRYEIRRLEATATKIRRLEAAATRSGAAMSQLGHQGTFWNISCPYFARPSRFHRKNAYPTLTNLAILTLFDSQSTAFALGGSQCP